MLFRNTHQLTLTSTNYLNLNHFDYQLFFLLKKNNLENLNISQFSLPTKTKKFTLLKSPHVYKTARTQLEIRTVAKSLIITNFTQNQLKSLKKIIKFFTENLNVALRIKLRQKSLLII